MGGGFADHFSTQAGAYARARPGYPQALFAWLSTLMPRVPGHARRAWDCGCGSGQAAIGLAEHFDVVVGTDASVAQLRGAARRANVRYAACMAERAAIADGAVDLTIVAQALHWLDHARFYAEVRRVSAAGAAIVAWSYGGVSVDAAVDEVLYRFSDTVIAGYWPPERRHVDSGYRTIPFPFDEIAAPALVMECRWTRDQLIDYVGTWSAVAAMRRDAATDPIPGLQHELRSAWPGDDARMVRWPLAIRAGYVRPR